MNMPSEITQDMVGLQISKVKAGLTEEPGEYSIYLTLPEISDEGLDLFGIEEDDNNWSHK